MQTLLEKEGALAFITAAFDKVKQLDAEDKERTKQAGAKFLKGSISEYTKDLIMTFPVMCDNSLPSETASMISKANERNIIAMLQMLFASINLKGNDGVQMLSQIHKNFSVNMAVDDFMDAMNKLASTSESADLSDPKIRQAVREMVYALKTPQKSFPVSSFSEKSLNDYLVQNTYGNTSILEVKGNLADTIKDQIYKELPPGAAEVATAGQKRSKVIDDIDKKKKEQLSKALKDSKDPKNSKFGAQDVSARLNTRMDFYQKQLLDQDVKKFNELAPALLIVKFNNTDLSGNLEATDTFIAGVKSRLISVDSMDIVERLASKNKTKLSFLNFIRATTGEISFISDFLLCTKQARIDAKNSVKKGPAAKMWSALSYRATKNQGNKLRGNGNDASSITTLVINQETVNLLKKEYGFDLERMANTKLIIDSYNLLGIVICDESLNVAKVYYVGNDTYETQAYSFLEREKSDKGYKEMINLLNNMGR